MENVEGYRLVPKCPELRIIKFIDLIKELRETKDCFAWDIVVRNIEKKLMPKSTCKELKMCLRNHEVLYVAHCEGNNYLVDIDTAWIIKLANGSNTLDNIVMTIIDKFAEPTTGSEEELKNRAIEIICAIANLTLMNLISWT